MRYRRNVEYPSKRYLSYFRFPDIRKLLYPTASSYILISLPGPELINNRFPIPRFLDAENIAR